MRRFRCAVLAAVAVVGFASVASAADLPTKAPIVKAPVAVPYNWTGFYIGANAGAIWSRSDYGLSTPGGNAPYFVVGDAAIIGPNGSGGFRSTDLTIGGQAGYNYQFGQGLVGAEVDWSRWGLSKSSTVVGPLTAPVNIQNTTTSITAGSLVTLRGRLGYVYERALFYVTGGAAYANINFTQSSSVALTSTVDAASNSGKWGWTVGGGAEYALDAHWRVKAEYLYADFGSTTFTTTPISPYGPASGTIPFTHNFNLKANIARLGVNYLF